MKRLVIFGIGQIAEVAQYLFAEDSEFTFSGFTSTATIAIDRSISVFLSSPSKT